MSAGVTIPSKLRSRYSVAIVTVRSGPARHVTQSALKLSLPISRANTLIHPLRLSHPIAATLHRPSRMTISITH